MNAKMVLTDLNHGEEIFLDIKNHILDNYGVVPTEKFPVEEAALARIEFLKDFLRQSGRAGYVLGISGGVDSTTTGLLCQQACRELRVEGYDANFIAVRLPYGEQKDEEFASLALDIINPDALQTVNIKSAVLELESEVIKGCLGTEATFDFARGNVKARMRMVAQYHIAELNYALVIGTDHNSEATMGFYTKHGDGACDLTVLNGLNKRQVRLLAKYLGAPEELYNKAPTADLEDLKPGKLDDEGFGFPYDHLDDFLEGKPTDKNSELKIVKQYHATTHKRVLIPGFPT